MNNKHAVKSKNGLFIFLTIIFGFAFCIMKLFSFGWISSIFFIAIVGYLILFNVSNILNAKIIIKSKYDYLRYMLLIFFSGLTFCDIGDTGPTLKILKFISDKISMYICQFSVVITVLLCITSIVIYIKKKKQSNITLNNQ